MSDKTDWINFLTKTKKFQEIWIFCIPSKLETLYRSPLFLFWSQRCRYITSEAATKNLKVWWRYATLFTFIFFHTIGASTKRPLLRTFLPYITVLVRVIPCIIYSWTKYSLWGNGFGFQSVYNLPEHNVPVFTVNRFVLYSCLKMKK